MKTKPNQNPLFVGDIVAKFIRRGLIKVLPPLTRQQIEFERFRVRKGVVKKKARVL